MLFSFILMIFNFSILISSLKTDFKFFIMIIDIKLSLFYFLRNQYQYQVLKLFVLYINFTIHTILYILF